VLFTRNPLSGEPEPYGEWLPGGQGDDVVGGTHTVQDMITLKNDQPAVHEELLTWAQTLEREHSEVQDIEFTMEQGRLYLLQTRTAKRSPQAAVRIAVDLVDEGVITPDDAIARVTPEQMRNVMSPRLDPQHSEQHRVASGEPACPGVATGIGVVDPDEAEARSRAGESIVLVRPTTSPNDVHGMIAAVAVVTDLGGSTSHAAVVTRALGRPSVVGVGDGVAETLAGKVITVDGEGGHVYEGEMPLLQTRVDEDPRLSRFAAWAAERSPLNVIEAAPDGVEFVDLDALGLGVATDHHHTTPSRDEITAALRGANVARGTLLSTPDGVAAAIAAGVTTVVAKPALPVQLMAARQALDLA
jgi:pyruvate,orthophosphate dikinase